MTSLRAVLVLALLQSTAWFSQAQAMINYNTPEAVTDALYDTAYQHFGFSPDTLWYTQPYLSNKLYGRLWFKVNQPSLGNQNDVFFCSPMHPSSYELGKVITTGGKSRVEVTVYWMNSKALKRRIWVYLKQIDGAWKVEDLDYGDVGKLSNYL